MKERSKSVFAIPTTRDVQLEGKKNTNSLDPSCWCASIFIDKFFKIIEKKYIYIHTLTIKI